MPTGSTPACRPSSSPDQTGTATGLKAIHLKPREAAMTEFLDVPGGRIAYDVTGDGPLVACVPGIGDMRATFRFLTPLLAQGGYPAARRHTGGHGESSPGGAPHPKPSIGPDIAARTRRLGGPAVVIGHSFASGSAVAAAAQAPADVAGIVLLSTAA